MPTGEDMLSWIRNRPLAHTRGEAATTLRPIGPIGLDDLDLARRIAASYRTASLTPLGDDSSGWVLSIAGIKADCDRHLRSGDPQAVAAMLRDPARTTLHYGFDELYDHAGLEDHGLARLASAPAWLYDTLRRLGEAVGSLRLEYPEAYHIYEDRAPAVEDILSGLDAAFGFRVTFPNVFPDEAGLATSRGVATFRAIQSLYQAYRIFDVTGRNTKSSIVEIGGGLGKTAFYARQFGLRDYTIIDLPLSNVAQANFLGRALGPETLSLFGENESDGLLKIRPPDYYLNGDRRFDVGVNIDSLVEMSQDTAETYLRHLIARSSVIISVNHEVNAFTTRELLLRLGARHVTRSPYWLRRGYVEELVELWRP